MSDFAVRLANLNDANEIANILFQIQEIHHLGRPDLFKSESRKYDRVQVEDIINKPESVVFSATNSENKIVGYCICYIREVNETDSAKSRKILFVDDLCVDESFRGNHIGETLFNSVREYAISQNDFDAINLNVWEFNQSAIKFYEKMELKTMTRIMELVL